MPFNFACNNCVPVMGKLKGTLYVAVGAASYGVLATFVKIAGGEGYATGAITFAQYATGAIVLFMLDLFAGSTATRGNGREALLLMATGTSLGLTSTFYYLSVAYLPVSVCIILLMQTVWMGILVDCIRKKQLPTLKAIIAVIIVLSGTLLATGLKRTGFQWHMHGLIYGLLAAVCYTIAMSASNHIAVERNVFFRSKYLVTGGLIAILLFWNVHIVDSLDWHLEWRFGLLLGLFGTILPPLLFNKGFPALGLGWGSMLAAIEIPVSIGTAYLFLKEQISFTQLLGCFFIIIAIIFLHMRFRKSAIAIRD
jgi:drug/metabolite transporter (DMT)-like permease